MKYILYKTINLSSKINNKYKIYIGVHQTEDPEIFDGYIGCGVYVTRPSTYRYAKTPFQRAVRKYGVESFKREILYIYTNKEQAYSIEKEIVNEKFIKSIYTYNIALGGDGGSLFASINSTALQSIIKKTVYLYNDKFQFIKKFDSRKDCATYLNCTAQSISHAIYNNQKIKQHFVYNNMINIDNINDKKQKLTCSVFYLYNKNNFYYGSFSFGDIKIKLEICGKKLNSIIRDNNGWYHDLYICNKFINNVPQKKTHCKQIEVYDLNNNLIEILPSRKQAMINYNLNSAEINRIIRGIKKPNKYIFKYSK